MPHVDPSRLSLCPLVALLWGCEYDAESSALGPRASTSDDFRTELPEADLPACLTDEPRHYRSTNERWPPTTALTHNWLLGKCGEAGAQTQPNDITCAMKTVVNDAQAVGAARGGHDTSAYVNRDVSYTITFFDAGNNLLPGTITQSFPENANLQEVTEAVRYASCAIDCTGQLAPTSLGHATIVSASFAFGGDGYFLPGVSPAPGVNPIDVCRELQKNLVGPPSRDCTVPATQVANWVATRGIAPMATYTRTSGAIHQHQSDYTPAEWRNWQGVVPPANTSRIHTDRRYVEFAAAGGRDGLTALVTTACVAQYNDVATRNRICGEEREEPIVASWPSAVCQRVGNCDGEGDTGPGCDDGGTGGETDLDTDAGDPSTASEGGAGSTSGPGPNADSDSYPDSGPGAPCNGFVCEDGQCIDANWVCDGIVDCSAQEDEWDCGEPPPDDPNCAGFTCDDGTCIEAIWECDGIQDCAGAEDEWCGGSVPN